MLREPLQIVFLDESGTALPDWIQKPLLGQVSRLQREFPGLRGDLAVIQSLLDQVGQRIVAKLAGGERIDNLDAYCYRCCNNAAQDAVSTREMFTKRCVNADEFPGTASALATTEFLVDRLPDILNAQEEEVVVRFHFWGERHKEISAKMGLSEVAVRSRLSRALEKLRRHLDTSSSTGL